MDSLAILIVAAFLSAIIAGGAVAFYFSKKVREVEAKIPDTDLPCEIRRCVDGEGVSDNKQDLAPGAQNVPKAVAYLDLGVGGYMDIGTDLTDEELATLPKGRHMLGVIGTYGVDGYVPAHKENRNEQ